MGIPVTVPITRRGAPVTATRCSPGSRPDSHEWHVLYRFAEESLDVWQASPQCPWFFPLGLRVNWLGAKLVPDVRIVH